MADRVRRNISMQPEQEARLLAACAADEGASLSHWLVSLGLARWRTLVASGQIHDSPPAATAASKPRKRR